MRIFLAHQLPPNEKDLIFYSFNSEKIHITLPDGSTDEFDFEGLPDGELDVEKTPTSLSLNPLRNARKENGVLYVVLTNYADSDAPEHIRFPEWIDHTDYEPPTPHPPTRQEG